MTDRRTSDEAVKLLRKADPAVVELRRDAVLDASWARGTPYLAGLVLARLPATKSGRANRLPIQTLIAPAASGSPGLDGRGMGARCRPIVLAWPPGPPAQAAKGRKRLAAIARLRRAGSPQRTPKGACRGAGRLIPGSRELSQWDALFTVEPTGRAACQDPSGRLSGTVMLENRSPGPWSLGLAVRAGALRAWPCDNGLWRRPDARHPRGSTRQSSQGQPARPGRVRAGPRLAVLHAPAGRRRPDVVRKNLRDALPTRMAGPADAFYRGRHGSPLGLVDPAVPGHRSPSSSSCSRPGCPPGSATGVLAGRDRLQLPRPGRSSGTGQAAAAGRGGAAPQEACTPRRPA